MVKRVGDTWIRADTSRVNPPSREGREGKREGGGTSTKALCRCCERANCFSFSLFIYYAPFNMRQFDV